MTQTNTDWNELKKEAISRLRSSKELSGKDGALVPLIKDLLETALEAELTEHLKEEKTDNRRNGKTSKTLKSDYGPIELQTSRDRQATFEPQLVKKRQTTLGSALNNKILALWSKGMSYSDISAHVEELYGLEVSESTITGITDALIPKVKEWQNRPLEAVYPIVWLDAIHFKVREEGRVISKAVYCILGLSQQGKKELLGMYLGQNESASFWLNVLSELKNRGVEDILIACIDNLQGFKEAISSIYPQTELQQCIVHQLRNSMRYVSYKDRKGLMKDVKAVYQANTAEMAEEELSVVASKWESKYPLVFKSWRKNWLELSAYFKYPPAIRKIIYTTNTIESFHAQLRKITKSKRVFSTDMSLMKLLYLVQEEITKKGVMPLSHWPETLSQFSIIFNDRLKLEL